MIASLGRACFTRQFVLAVCEAAGTRVVDSGS